MDQKTEQAAKAPIWGTSFLRAELEHIESVYGPLAKEPGELARMIENVDRLFREGPPPVSTEKAFKIRVFGEGDGDRLYSRYPGGLSNADLDSLQTERTFKPTMQILCSAVYCAEAIRNAKTDDWAKEFYRNLLIALRYVVHHEQARCASGETTGEAYFLDARTINYAFGITAERTAQKASASFAGWRYMGEKRDDGPKTADLIQALHKIQNQSEVLHKGRQLEYCRKYIIDKEGENYRLCFNGKWETLPNQDGSFYIIYLMTHRGYFTGIELKDFREGRSDVSKEDFDRLGDRVSQDDDGNYELTIANRGGNLGHIESASPSELRAAIDTLQVKIEKASKQADKEEYERQIEILEKRLKRDPAKDRFGKPRSLGCKVGTARLSVYRAIDRVRNKISDPSLKTHLKKDIITGNQFYYDHDNGISWFTEDF